MPKPNILVLMPDTFRFDTLGCAGHPTAKTPNLDRIAGMGVRFERAYSSSPICMTARSNCLSGLYCHNTGQWSNYGHLPSGSRTYMSLLRDNGYRTVQVGKSHLYGHGTPRGSPKLFHLDTMKEFMGSLGFDDVLETTGPLATCNTDSIMTDDWAGKGILDLYREDYAKRARAGGDRGALWPSPMPEDDHMDAFIGRTAVDYLKGYDRDEPFAMFVGFGGPHSPWDPPKSWAEKYRDADVPDPIPEPEKPAWLVGAAAAYHDAIIPAAIERETSRTIQRLYYAKVAFVDHWIGKILEALERKDMLDDTAIVFWSDHGDRLCDRNGLSKSVFFDDSVRVPMLLRLPGNPGAGTVCCPVCSINDLFPTILEAAGIKPPACFGTSLVRCTADPQAALHDAVFSEIAAHGHRSTMIRTARHKMVVNARSEVLQLFDMQEDSPELVNLAGRPDMAGVEQELEQRILRWRLATETDQR
jgi:choline-sulfatase